jgi:3-oxoacyl-[acyl-carrier protein] reductase
LKPSEGSARGADDARRIGQQQDIAPAAVFLASADAAWITGETLLIAGGLR